jgi:hypothetical protein
MPTRSSFLFTGVFVLWGLTAVSAPVWSQPADHSAAQKAAIEKLSHWFGEWQGTGWSMRGPEAREEFTVTEVVQPKLGGVVVLVEGRGKGKVAGNEETVVGHDALAVLSFDPATKTYRFQHYTMQGGSGEDEMVLTDTGMMWELKSANLPFRMRFTIELDGDTWHEYGEMSRDGENWIRTMEMTLERVRSDSAKS